MKITWQWLGEYVDLTGLTPQQVAQDLTNAGIPVEWMQPIAGGVDGVVVGDVLEVRSHENADRLRVCQVEAGTGGVLNIVCGAQNVAAGQRVPVALVGASLPDGKIKKSKIRGIESQGMICSAAELGLDVRLMSKEASVGILVLPNDAPIGESIVNYMKLDDMVMELELTPNRSDCLSLRGVAYEVGAIYGRKVTMPHVSLDQVAGPQASDLTHGSLPLSVSIDTKKCSAYSALVVSDLELKSSPLWMQMRLNAVGTRAISNLVDITNYVMYEWGQPLHAFDYDAIRQHAIVVRQAERDERLVTLDDQERSLTPDMIVISDPERGLGLAGVMGGLNSEVKDDTSRVVIESAIFDPLQTRRTGKQLALRSEASLRFEKGMDPDATLMALARAAQLMTALGGGRVASQPVVAGDLAWAGVSEPLANHAHGAKDDASSGAPKGYAQVLVRAKRVSKVLGYTVSTKEIMDVCDRLQFEATLQVTEQGDTVIVRVPARRPDILIEEDMIEEVARLLGFDRIPTAMIEGPLSGGYLTKEQKLRRALRDHLVALGMNEIWTYSFISPDEATKLRLIPDHPLSHMATLLRPLSDDRRALRTSMLFSLLQVAEFNTRHQQQDLRLFEIGTVFHPHQVPLSSQPSETPQLAGIVTGSVQPFSMHEKARPFDFYDVKGIVEGVLESVGIARDATDGARVNYVRAQEPYFHPGQSALIQVEGFTIGAFGKLHPGVTKAYDLADVYYFEIDVDALVALTKGPLYVTELPRYPRVERDLALVLRREIAVQDLIDTVRKAAGPYLKNVDVFDVYTGEHVADIEKSIALHLVFQSMERTLQDDEIKRAIDAIIDAANTEHDATLRS